MLRGLCLGLALAVAGLGMSPYRPLPPPPLRFAADGTFTVLQLTDLHFSAAGRMDRTLRLIESLLRWERPQLVVFGGDVITGSTTLPPADAMREAEAIWDRLAELLHRHEQPWVTTFGNHLGQVDRRQLGAYDAAFRLSYTQHTNVPGPFQPSAVDLHGPTGERVARVYAFDSGDLNCEGRAGWGCVNGPQREWYRALAREAAVARQGLPLPAVAFFHIPHDAFLAMWNAKGGFGNKYSPIACGPDRGAVHRLFEEEGDVRAVFVGHDHHNDFCGTWRGVLLCYGLKSGFEDDYRTDHATHTDWMGARVVRLTATPPTGPGPPAVTVATWRRLANGTRLPDPHGSGGGPRSPQPACEMADDPIPSLMLVLSSAGLGLLALGQRRGCPRWGRRLPPRRPPARHPACGAPCAAAAALLLLPPATAWLLRAARRPPTADADLPAWQRRAAAYPEFRANASGVACQPGPGVTLPTAVPTEPPRPPLPRPFSHLGADGRGALRCPAGGVLFRSALAGATAYPETAPAPLLLPIPETVYSVVRATSDCVLLRCAAQTSWHCPLQQKRLAPPPPPPPAARLSTPPLSVVLCHLPAASLQYFALRWPRLAHFLHLAARLPGTHVQLLPFPSPLATTDPPPWRADGLWAVARGGGYRTLEVAGPGPRRQQTGDDAADTTITMPLCDGDALVCDHPLHVLATFWAATAGQPRLAALDLTAVPVLEGPLLQWLQAWHAAGDLNTTAVILSGPGCVLVLLPRWLGPPATDATEWGTARGPDVARTVRWLLRGRPPLSAGGAGGGGATQLGRSWPAPRC